jgi:hypothetical protein
VGDFGEIYTDHFVFETSLRNEYAEGSAACQITRVYLLCEGSAIWVPLCAKGCISNIDLYFTYFYTSGKREDLSAFGVDFKNDVKLRIESDSGQAKILINDQLAYTFPATSSGPKSSASISPSRVPGPSIMSISPMARPPTATISMGRQSRQPLFRLLRINSDVMTPHQVGNRVLLRLR